MVMTRRKINTEQERYGGYANLNLLNNFDAYYDNENDISDKYDTDSTYGYENSVRSENRMTDYESDLFDRLQRNIPQQRTYTSTNSKSLQDFRLQKKTVSSVNDKNISNVQKFAMLLIYILVVAILLTVIISTSFAGTTAIPQNQYVDAQVIENLPAIPTNLEDMMVATVNGESQTVESVQPAQEQSSAESNLDWFDGFCKFIESVVGG